MTIYEPFIPSLDEIIRIKLELAEIKPQEWVFDLGCGDARVLIQAARDFEANCVGYELRPDLGEEARDAVRLCGLEDRITIVRQDLISADISTADVLVLYLSKEVIAPFTWSLKTAPR